MTEDEQLMVGSADEAFYGALVEDDADDLYDNAPCAYLSTLPDGTIVKANATFLTWTGFAREELIGRRRFQELLAPGDRIFYETHYSPALRMQGSVREIAVEVVSRAGDRLPVLVNSVLKSDASGTPIVIRTAAFDATERRAYERELLEARRRAESSEARARALARTLQSTFLPLEMPSVPGLEIAGGYRPAGDGSEVGGDFYDAFAIAPGRWGVVLGDVCGKGATAAVLTTLARYTVRSEAMRTPDAPPSEILERLHHAFLRDHPDQFCTALLLTVEPIGDTTGGGVRVVIAAGGHLLPVRRSAADLRLETVGAPGSLVGLLPEASFRDAVVDLRPDDVLVLHTDGITEARGSGGDFYGEDGLRSLLARVDLATAQAIADALVADALSLQEGDARDDIAVVVLRATPASTS